MQQQSLTPVAAQERIQTIDIIRGFALLGVVILNFTLDDGDAGLYDGFAGLGDQIAYWTMKLLLDDRFQTIYCFLFGLGFAIQMQRAAARNSFFGFAFLRRMLTLYLISMSVVILTGEGFNVLPYYATVGVLLLIFWKIPVKFLPILAVFFFLLPWTRNAIVNLKAESKRKALLKTIVTVDTTILDQYVGVYQGPNVKTIFRRSNDSLIGEGPARQFYLTPLSDSHFIRKDFNHIITFTRDSARLVHGFTASFPDGTDIPATRIQTDFQQALQQQLQLRAANNNQTVKTDLTYTTFVRNNANKYQTYLKNWKWNDFQRQFLWQNNYKIGYILVLFLLGLYAGKRRVFQNVSANRKFLTNVFKWGLIAGAAGVLFSTGFQAWNFFYDIEWNTYSRLTRTLVGLPWDWGIIFMAMAYITGLTLLLENSNPKVAAWKKRLTYLEPVGRLGLTNYFLQLFAYLIILKNISWFWGLGGKIGCVYRLLLAIAVYVLLYFFSRWWLKHFRMGPFEWLWRSLTYLKFQPMRLRESNETKHMS